MSKIQEINNPLFTRENAAAIVVPGVVKDDLCGIVEDKLKKAGLYYRISSRIKTPDSILEKMFRRGYGVKGSKYEHKKLQDLIGVRIILYYEDDISIVRKLLDSLFSEPGEWETTEITDSEFHAMKINGIFKIPEYLRNMIVNNELKDYVDDTLEIQIRTNAFEGWHEIEHDLHYKGSAFGDSSAGLSRRMNSILATYELCDDSLVKLLEDLGHQHYKDQKWEDMIRCHYRIKFSADPLLPEIRKCFDEDTDLAKSVFKFERARLFEALWNRNADMTKRYTVNDIVKVVNEIGLRNDRLFEIFADTGKKSTLIKRKKFEPFKSLGTFPVFASGVEICTDEGVEKTFDRAVEMIYSWIRSRLSEVFDLPESPVDFNDEKPGYRIIMEYDRNDLRFSQMTTHPDALVASRMWISNATVELRDDKLVLVVTNRFAEPVEKYRDTKNGLFSRPNFYGEIADNIGIIDVEPLCESAKEVDEDNIEELFDLIYSGRRHFPVVVFMVSDRSWVDKFDINYFAFLVGYYAHIRIIYDEKLQSRIAKEYHLDPEKYMDSITVVYPGEAPVTSYKDDILDSSYEIIKYETKKYWNEKGCRAFRRRLIADIREKIVENVDDDVYKYGNSFKLAQADEKWDVVDENGDPYGYTIERADAKHLKGELFHRVVSIYTISRDGRVLITRRSMAKSHPHKWEVTCGSVLAGESPVEGAIRELKEETGIDVEEKDLIPVYKHSDRRRHCVYYGFVVFIETSDTRIDLEPDETDKYEFMPVKEFPEFAKSGQFVRSESERFVKFEKEIKEKMGVK